MKAFESDGKFWLPESPDRAIFGRLKWQHNGTSELNVTGTLKGGRLNLGDRVPVIHGAVENTPDGLGGGVTLWGAFMMARTNSSSGLVRDRYRPQVLLAGQHLGAESEVTFKSAELQFSSLPEWAESLSGLESQNQLGGRKYVFAFSYAPPDPLVVPCPGATLKLYTTGSSKQRRRHYEIEERIGIGVAPDNPMRLGEYNERFVYPLQNFFTFAMNGPTAVEQWIVSLPEDGQDVPQDRVEVSYPRYYAGPKDDDKESSYSPLFTLDHVKDRLPDLFRAWLDISVRLRDTCNVYFGLQYSTRMFTDWRFQTVVHALTLYGSSVGIPRVTDQRMLSILNTLKPDDAEYVTKLLGTSLLLNAEAVLGGLMAEHGSEIEWLYGRPRHKFVGRVLNTLHYLQRPDPVNVLAASQGSELFRLTEQLNWLMKLCLLKEVGFTKDDRRRLIERNPEAQHSRAATAKIVADPDLDEGAEKSKLPEADISFQFIVPADDLLATARQMSESPASDEHVVGKTVLELSNVTSRTKAAVADVSSKDNYDLAVYFDFNFGDSIAAAKRLKSSSDNNVRHVANTLLNQANAIAASKTAFQRATGTG